MQEHFLDYTQSLAVKELGFDEPCLKMSEHRKLCPEQEKPNGCQLHNLHCGYPYCTIDSTITPIPLPLKSQFFKWAREKYGIKRQQVSYDDDYDNYWYEKWFNTYEEAEDACINGIIELIKNK